MARPFGWGILYIEPLCFPVVAPPKSCASVENECGAPFGRTCCAYIGGRCAPPNLPATKRCALTGGQRASAHIQREGASAPPAPTPRKYKNKNLAVDGGVGPAFVPECRTVQDRTERPQDDPGAMPTAHGAIQNMPETVLPSAHGL